MQKYKQNLVKGVAVGALAGTAVGAMGAYIAQQNPKQIKKAMHKAAAAVEKTIINAEKMMHY